MTATEDDGVFSDEDLEVFGNSENAGSAQPMNTRVPHGWRSPHGQSTASNHDLDLDFSDDEVLLDWEQYAGMRGRLRLFGRDCTPLLSAFPCLRNLPPSWWYRYSRRQRKLMAAACSCCSCLVVLAVALMIISAAFSSFQPSGAAGSPSVPATPALSPPFPPGPALLDSPEYRFCSWQGFRLPETFRPSEYTLDLDLSDFAQAPGHTASVQGRVQIKVEALEAFGCIAFHADLDGMEISSAAVTASAGGSSLEGAVKRSPAFESSGIVSVWLLEVQPPGEVVLDMSFSYTLGTSLSGLYLSNYTGPDGEQAVMAVTQFESTSAREAFPCFDEPALKATFAVRVTVPDGFTVLANMPEAVSTPVGTAEQHVFEKTPAMSTYLVAVVVGKLEAISKEVPPHSASAEPCVVRVFGTPEHKDYMQTALDFAVASLKKYQTMLGEPYALPKLDLVAVPDFSAGAMENWGLVTFRETDLLVKQDEDSANSIRRVAQVIAHELAHQWFGNLVTLEYWGDLWLNEGFASYFEYIGAQAALEPLFPGINLWELFYFYSARSAMLYDTVPDATHPLSMAADNVEASEQIQSFFNSVPYDKGASVLRMLATWMDRFTASGPEAGPFVTALQAYLEEFKFSSATSLDLLEALQEANTGLDEGNLKTILHKWVFEKYVPIINVTNSGLGGFGVSITQEPLPPVDGACSAGSQGEDAPWQVPLSFIAGTVATPEWTLMTGCQSLADIYILQGEEDFIKLNAGQVGLYSVAYSEGLWARLVAAAGRPPSGNGKSHLPAADLAGLMSDAFYQATFGKLSISVFFDLVKTLGARPLELETWLLADEILSSIYTRLKTTPAFSTCTQHLATVVRTKMTSAFVAVGNAAGSVGDTSGLQEGAMAFSLSNSQAQPQPYLERVLRPVLLGLAGDMGDALVKADAENLLQAAVSNNHSVPGDVRYLTYRMAAKSSPSGWSIVNGIFLTSVSATEKQQALYALGGTTSPELMDLALGMTLSGVVRPQDAVWVIRNVGAGGGIALDKAVQFARSKWNEIGSLFSSKAERSHQLGGLLQLYAGYSTQEKLDELQAWWDDAAKEYINEESYLLYAIGGIKENILWLQHNLDDTCTWLSDQIEI